RPPETVAPIFALNSLERKLRSQLNSPRAPASQERVADSDVARSHDLIRAIAHFPVVGASPETATASIQIRCGGLGHVACRIGNERWQQRTRDIVMVQNVEEFSAQLEIEALGQPRVLGDGQIPLPERRANQSVASQ